MDVTPEPADVQSHQLLGFREVLTQSSQSVQDEAQRGIEGLQEALSAEPPQGVLAGESPRALPAVLLQSWRVQALDVDRSLFGELRYCKLHGTAKKNKGACCF